MRRPVLQSPAGLAGTLSPECGGGVAAAADRAVPLSGSSTVRSLAPCLPIDHSSSYFASLNGTYFDHFTSNFVRDELQLKGPSNGSRTTGGKSACNGYSPDFTVFLLQFLSGISLVCDDEPTHYPRASMFPLDDRRRCYQLVATFDPFQFISHIRCCASSSDSSPPVPSAPIINFAHPTSPFSTASDLQHKDVW